MSKIIQILISFLSITCLTNSQWIPFIDNNLTPFSSVNPLSEELILPKDTKNIPIIVLLKPRRAKSLANTNEENVERSSGNGQELDTSQWVGMPDINSDNIPNNKVNIRQQLIDLGKAFESRESMSVVPKPTTSTTNSEDVIISSKARGDERVQWPSKGKKGVSPVDLASISHLLPKFAALSQSNGGFGKLDGLNFEEALKKFASNLTDFEHRISGSGDGSDSSADQVDGGNGDGSNDSEDNTDSPIESKSSANGDLRADEVAENVDNNDKKPSYGFLRDKKNTNNENQESVQKSSPIIAERQQIKIPINPQTDSILAEIQRGFQPVSETHFTKGWLPIKNKKPKPKPALHDRQKQYLTTKATSGNKNHLYGVPEMSSAFPQVLRPRRYPPHFGPSFNPSVNPMFNSMHAIRHSPFNKYSSYLTESDMRPTFSALEMQSDTNKPQHMDPIKAEPVTNDEVGKHKDGVEEKEHIIDDKNQDLMGGKDHGIDEKHAMHGLGGEGLIGHHLSCCDLLLGQHNGHKHVIHEEVIGAHFDDEKLIQKMVMNDHHKVHHQPIHHHFQHHSHQHLPLNHKFGCHEELGLGNDFYGGQQFVWPQQVYRPPHNRPKFGLFHKPLFFG